MAASIKAVTMPKWGMEMTEGVVNAWHVAEGASVAAGDDLVDIETSKIVNTVTAPVAGVLRRITAQPQETLPVGALLGVLAPPDTTDEEIALFIGAGSSAQITPQDTTAEAPRPASSTPPQAQATQAPAAAIADLSRGEDDSACPATPIARRLARQYGINLHNIEASGRHNRVTKADLERVLVAAGRELITHNSAARRETLSLRQLDDSAVRATPVARRLAGELGINLHDCRISGSRGRVSKADVEAAAALRPQPSAPASADNSAAPTPAFREIPVSGMRKTIAARLQQSKQSAPHFRVQIDAEIDALLAVRNQLNNSNTDARVSVNDFIVKACASALMKVPAINVQFDGSTVRQFADADIAVAVALEEGLITPIVRSANSKGLIAISNELRDLVTRAKLGNLKPEEFQGGSFSLSNLGMFGVKQFDAIINPPQGAILAVGAAEQRPVVHNGELKVATVVSLSLSSDHRIIDGALAARFMAELRQFLEQPALMLG